MFGCESVAAMNTSRSNRSAPHSRAISGFSTFTTTSRSCLRPRARNTVAIPPRRVDPSLAVRSRLIKYGVEHCQRAH